MEHIENFVSALSQSFYSDDEMIRNAIITRSSFNLIHYEMAFKVDIFILGKRDFDRTKLDRRVLSIISTVPDRTMYVTSHDDIILAKLERFRMGDEVSDR